MLMPVENQKVVINFCHNRTYDLQLYGIYSWGRRNGNVEAENFTRKFGNAMSIGPFRFF